jgi:hypothetical protein
MTPLFGAVIEDVVVTARSGILLAAGRAILDVQDGEFLPRVWARMRRPGFGGVPILFDRTWCWAPVDSGAGRVPPCRGPYGSRIAVPSSGMT